MDWSQMSVARDRILGDSGDWSTFPQHWIETPPKPADWSNTASFMASRLYRRAWDVVTPDWKGKVNRGEIVSNDYLEVSLKSVFQPMLYECVLRTDSTHTANVLGGSWLWLWPDGAGMVVPLPDTLGKAIALVSDDPGSLRAEAHTGAYARVDVSELEMLASLGEMPETVSWFGDVLRRLIAAMAMLKKRQYLATLNQLKRSLTPRNPKQWKKLGKKTDTAVQDLWMEWRYAIRPLIFEVQSYLAALDSAVESELRKTARKSEYSSSTVVTHPSTTWGEYGYSANVEHTVTTSRSIRAGVLYSLNPETMGWWTHLGLDAPTSAAWAITRLSFIFDWFFNIGQWIASWEPRLGLTPLTSWVVETRSTSIEGVTHPTGIAYPPFTLLSRSVKDPGGYSCELQVKARWVNPDRQILPTFHYRGLNTAKVADLVVIGRKLASQLLR